MHGVALVIGESKYEQLPVLTNPGKDARDIDRLLGDLGFDVTRVLNADGDKMRDAISQFEDDAKDADVALIYYSGHGIEAKGAELHRAHRHRSELAAERRREHDRGAADPR